MWRERTNRTVVAEVPSVRIDLDGSSDICELVGGVARVHAPAGWGFGRAALKAALKLKYNPRVIDGVGQEVPNVMYKFTFQMAK